LSSPSVRGRCASGACPTTADQGATQPLRAASAALRLESSPMRPEMACRPRPTRSTGDSEPIFRPVIWVMSVQACAGHERPLSKKRTMTLRSTSLRAWIAALVTVLAVSVAMFATAAAAAGQEKPVVTAITVRPLHAAQVVRGDDGKAHLEYDLLVVS